MPPIKVVFFKDPDNVAPAKIWLDEIVVKRDRRIAAKLELRIEMLRNEGRNLRRPISDYLRDGIYELRAKLGAVNYRLLYFFEGSCAVISDGCTKEARIPTREIEIAIGNKQLFKTDPEKYTFKEKD